MTDESKEILNLYKIRDDIMMQVDRALVKGAEAFRDSVIPYSNWASKIGHPCTRHLCYFRTHFKEQIIPALDMLKLFKVGRPLEQIVEDEVKDAGFNIYQKKKSITWQKYNIGCKMDRWMEYAHFEIPCEIKSISPYAFKSVHDIEDFIKSERWYMRMYPAQTLCYCWATNSQFAWLIPLNKITGEWRMIPVYAFQPHLMEIMETTLQKVERVNRYVKEFEVIKDKATVDAILPNRILDIDICIECEYRNICQPIIQMQKDAKKIPAPEGFSDKLQRWVDTKETSAEHDKLDREIKDYLHGIELHETVVIADKFLISCRKRHQVEETRHIEEKDIWSYYIKPIEGADKGKTVTVFADTITASGKVDS